MRKRLCLLLLVLSLLLTACSPATQPEPTPAPEAPVPEEPPEPELSQREKEWTEDIEFFRENIKEKHADPFYFCPEEEFDWRLDQLAARVGDLSDNDIFFELTAIAARLGDIHLNVYPGASHIYDRMFPAKVKFFDNKLYLTAFQEGFEHLRPYLLREIVAVNGVDIAYLERKIESVSNPANRWYSRETFTELHYFFVPAFFDWAGCGYTEGYTFQILNENQEVESVEIPLITGDEWKQGQWICPENWDSLRYLRSGIQAEYIEAENGGCVYVSFAVMDYPSSIRRLINEAAELLEEHADCGKLVIDLRMNTGGWSTVIWALQDTVRQLKPECTYVLTGGGTMSMAINAIACFRGGLDAITVGEPTGQFSSFFAYSGDAENERRFTLPHSQLEVEVSNLWNDSATDLPLFDIDYAFKERYDETGRLYEWENTILPDVYVYQDIEDIRQGRDSVMEWVLAQ